MIIKSEFERKCSGECSEALRLAAQALGLSFEQSGSIKVVKKFGEFQLFSQGCEKRIVNRMWGRRNGIDVMVFGYEYTKDHVSTYRRIRFTTYKQTVLSFESNGVHLPAFALHPENLSHKIEQAFGYQDIDFDAHPEFSKLYLLRGRDEAHIRRVFKPNIISFLERYKCFCLEGKGNILTCYRPSELSEPDDVKRFFEEEESIQRMFSAG